MNQPICLFGAFARHLQSQPDALLYRYLVEGDPGGQVVEWTFAQAYRRCAAVAALLSEHGLAGKRVLLLAQPGLDYVATFLGCLMARVVVVPAYPPVGARSDNAVARLVAIAAAAQIDAVVTTTPIAHLAPAIVRGTPLADVPWLPTDAVGDPAPGVDWLAIRPRDELAYLQFTSGSTSDPKGVMVTHGNVAHNSDLIRQKFGHSGQTRGASWLPPYHDMGLIGGILQPLHVGFEVTLMSPLDFLKRPIRWIEAISRFRVTTTGGPDFAYALCTRRFRPGATAIDLSSWRVAFNGAEPIRPDTLDRFCETFGPHGFARTAFYPCYGLAEATLIVTGGEVDQAPVVQRADRDQLARGRFTAAAPSAAAVELVACGTPAADQQLAIVDPYSGAQVADGVVGEIWIAGGSVAAGYWNRPDATHAAFAARRSDDAAAGPYARTGDLGFVAGGQLYVTGRHKDLIIVRGRNLYPHDIEDTVAAAHPAIRAGCVAVFSTSAGTAEGIAVAAEVQAASQQDLTAVIDAIRAAVIAAHDVGATEVLLLPSRAMPKTSSGKLTRAACRAGIADGSITCIARWRVDQPRPAAREPGGPAGDAAQPAGRIRAWLRDAIAARTGLPAADIATGRPLVEYGLDSQMAVEIAGDLEAALHHPVPATLAWNHPTIDAIAAYIAGAGTGAGAGAGAGAARVPAPAVTAGAAAGIAIVAVGCRFPGGADGPEAFWRLLCSSVDPIGPVPADRWTPADHVSGHLGGHLGDADPGRGQAARLGGFVDRVDEFDAAFFAISPREAEALDPQQRLLLEVCYETLDRAGLASGRLAGSSTGVFVGISSNDYYLRQERAGTVDPRYSVTGNLASVAAGRVSYALGLVGPCLAVDTACSSSLVAVHLACQSLRAGECEQALAGGVNLILGPEGHVYFSAMHATSPRGRCASFDASADGYVRSEGCGMVLLKPLEAAQRDGDRILAVIRGSAVNHDGRSNGLTAPSGRAQEAVIRRALASAGVHPAQVSYVETHGTGTPLGDPIEVDALAAVYGAGRAAGEPLRIGSAKSQIGHAEAAAGIAGLIKAALALDAEILPGNLHFETPNPHIRWAALPVSVVSEAAPWPRGDAPRFAGVSSFGFSGSNAHVVLEQAPAARPPAPAPERMIDAPQLIAIAAHTPEALAARLAQVEQLARSSDAALVDLARSIATSSSHLVCRAATVATARGLEAAIQRCRREPRPAPIRKLAFAFTGQGAQRAGMGLALAERWPVIADALQRCDEIFRAASGLPRGLREVMWAAPGTPAAALLDRTDYTQAAMFAFAYAVACWWRALGIAPDVVLGHSIGEIAAACAAGVLDPEAAMRLVVARGQAMSRLPPGGAMVAVGAAEHEVAALIDGWPDTAIAAINGPGQVVVAGPETSIARVAQHAATAGWQTSRLAVSHAFHSPLMAPMVDELGRRAAELPHRAPQILWISAVTGAPVGEGAARAGYWTEHVLAPVRFHQALAALPADVDAVVEIGPQPALTAIARRAGSADARRWIPCARPEREEVSLLEAAAALYQGGLDLDLARLFPADRRRIALPSYPWQRRRYWTAAPASTAAPAIAAVPASVAPPAIAPLAIAPLAPVALAIEPLAIAPQAHVAPAIAPPAISSPAPAVSTLELPSDAIGQPALDLVIRQLEVMRQQLALLAGGLDADADAATDAAPALPTLSNLHTLEGHN